MIRLITLRGEESGSAKINITDRSTQITVSLRRRQPEGTYTAYLLSGERARGVQLRNWSGSTGALDVRGVLLANEKGEFIAYGTCCGMTEAEFERAKANIRLTVPDSRTMQYSRTAQNSRTGAARPNAAGSRSGSDAAVKTSENRSQTNAENANEAQEWRPSQITEGILGMARELFSVRQPSENGSAENNRQSVEIEDSIGKSRDNDDTNGNSNNNDADGNNDNKGNIGNNGNSDKNSRNARNGNAGGSGNGRGAGMKGTNCENCASADEEAVMDPFPALFPNSYWKRKIGNTDKMTGVAMVRGVRYEIVALKAASGYPPRGLQGNLRRVRARDGKFYWLGIMRK